jgi:hypothetical protein
MSGVLVIVELGAEWPAWTGTGVEMARRGGRRVLSQEEGETPEAFTDRVTEHLGSLFANRVALERAVVACNERSDQGAMRARGKLGQALIGALANRRAWQLLFTASGRTGKVRHSLADLAAVLSSGVAGGVGHSARSAAAADLNISVRFGDEMPLVQQAPFAVGAPNDNVTAA